MKAKHLYRFSVTLMTVVFILTSTGCANLPGLATEPPPPTTAPTTAPTEAPVDVPTETSPTDTPVSEVDANILFRDNFTDPASSWPEDKFDNYFIGYHEPEYYHVELTGANYRTTVFEPQKRSFSDATIELKVLTAAAKTAPEGDFRYGLAFRRSGDQYYAFTISPRSKNWFVLKSSPNGLTILKEGTDEEIHDVDVDDLLRVDLQGSTFTFHINNQIVGEVTDTDYTAGEVGFYVESFDSPNTHIHFDDLVIRNLEAPQVPETGAALLYQDDFTNPSTAWPERKFDNYFVGYHEPENYHIEITGPNYKTTVFEPQKRSFDDATVELKVFTASAKTAPEGDFRYGIAFRRSGDQYYAFAVSPRTKRWYVIKSSPNAVSVLSEGTDESLNGIDVDDILRVDTQGSSFLFHINNHLVGQVTDTEYAAGEVGFYVESFDSPNTHIHFNDLVIREFEVSVVCEVRALTLNVRNGPGTNNPSITFLKRGAAVQPVGRTENSQWLKINVDGREQPGWIFNDSSFVGCVPDTDLLPVATE